MLVSQNLPRQTQKHVFKRGGGGSVRMVCQSWICLWWVRSCLPNVSLRNSKFGFPFGHVQSFLLFQAAVFSEDKMQGWFLSKQFSKNSLYESGGMKWETRSIFTWEKLRKAFFLSIQSTFKTDFSSVYTFMEAAIMFFFCCISNPNINGVGRNYLLLISVGLVHSHFFLVLIHIFTCQGTVLLRYNITIISTCEDENILIVLFWP